MSSGAEALAEIGVKGRASEALYYICQGFSNAVIAHKCVSACKIDPLRGVIGVQN